MPRSGAVGILVVAALSVATACSGDRRTPQVDTSAGRVGVIDSAPAAVATTVAAVLTDENVFALLDTAYGGDDRDRSTGADQNRRCGESVRGEGGKRERGDAEWHQVDGRPLNIAPVLPDRDVIRDQPETMRDLQAKSGADFNRAFSERQLNTASGHITSRGRSWSSQGALSPPRYWQQ